LSRLHAVAPPRNQTVLITGTAQTNRDCIDGITSRLPLVFGFIAVVMLVLLFLFTGSVTLPVKAVLLNMLSLTATFGALVWIFQDGQSGRGGNHTNRHAGCQRPVLMFCVAFGLSMDYEVFLLARIREYWLGSRRTRADNDESMRTGSGPHGQGNHRRSAAHGRLSSPALISAGVSFMRMFGLRADALPSW